MYTLAVVNSNGDNKGLSGKYFLVGAEYYSIVMSEDYGHYIFRGHNMDTHIYERNQYTDLAFENNDLNYFLELVDEGFILEIQGDSTKIHDVVYNDVCNPLVFSVDNLA